MSSNHAPLLSTSEGPPDPRTRRWESCSFASAVIYLTLTLVFWVSLALGGERWWFCTLFLYGPRWVALLPLLVLTPAALWHRRLLIPLVPACLVLLCPVMGFCVPWRAWGQPAPASTPLLVLTCNVDGGHLDAAAFGTYIAVVMPDVVALQEWRPEDEKAVFWQQEWHVRATADGLCVASRFPIRNVESLRPRDLGAPGGLMRCVLDTPDGPLEFVNVHLATPRPGIEALLHRERGCFAKMAANTALRWMFSERAKAWVGEPRPGMVVVGDFNLPADSPIFRTYWSGWDDGFSTAGFGIGNTKFTRWFGARIDHILTGPGSRARRCRVGPDVGSDHRPLLAEVAVSAR